MMTETSRTAFFINAQKDLQLTTSATARHPVAPVPDYANPCADKGCVPDPMFWGAVMPGTAAAPLEAKTHIQPLTFISVSSALEPRWLPYKMNGTQTGQGLQCLSEHSHSAVGQAQTQSLHICWGVADKLPRPNLVLLKLLLSLLHHISQNAETNRMDSSNLAICIGPNMLSPGTDNALPLEVQKEMNDKQLNRTAPLDIGGTPQLRCPSACDGMSQAVPHLASSEQKQQLPCSPLSHSTASADLACGGQGAPVATVTPGLSGSEAKTVADGVLSVTVLVEFLINNCLEIFEEDIAFPACALAQESAEHTDSSTAKNYIAEKYCPRLKESSPRRDWEHRNRGRSQSESGISGMTPSKDLIHTPYLKRLHWTFLDHLDKVYVAIHLLPAARLEQELPVGPQRDSSSSGQRQGRPVSSQLHLAQKRPGPALSLQASPVAPGLTLMQEGMKSSGQGDKLYQPASFTGNRQSQVSN
ncbi:hypothetical protein IHE44_0009330 [Lamprotornis superbus]|uniref:Rho-GAP domain-containing protein n=1 Tax=Lamprotornis superbus TaxID=245042 RepID=A0A835P305_9PASS|nr:hypothetical protein IHE44_0009330 [Lamprotornis superbus]